MSDFYGELSDILTIEPITVTVEYWILSEDIPVNINIWLFNETTEYTPATPNGQES